MKEHKYKTINRFTISEATPEEFYECFQENREIKRILGIKVISYI